MNSMEYSASMDSIHKYFDYSVSRDQTSMTKTPDQLFNSDRINNQFATLCLSMLHYRFGNHKESSRVCMLYVLNLRSDSYFSLF